MNGDINQPASGSRGTLIGAIIITLILIIGAIYLFSSRRAESPTPPPPKASEPPAAGTPAANLGGGDEIGDLEAAAAVGANDLSDLGVLDGELQGL